MDEQSQPPEKQNLNSGVTDEQKQPEPQKNGTQTVNNTETTKSEVNDEPLDHAKYTANLPPIATQTAPVTNDNAEEINSQPDEDLQPRMQSNGDSISWTASEFVEHAKSPRWYGAVVLGGAILAGIFWLIKRDMITTIVIFLCGVVFAWFGGRKPRQLTYQLDEHGFSIGQRHFNYGQFRSFALMPEGAAGSISLLPLKRFSPITALYYDPKDEEKIVNILAARLPLEPRDHDPLDRLMHRIRF